MKKTKPLVRILKDLRVNWQALSHDLEAAGSAEGSAARARCRAIEAQVNALEVYVTVKALHERDYETLDATKEIEEKLKRMGKKRGGWLMVK